MQITDVISHQLVVNVDEPFTSSRCWYYKTKGALVVEIRTDAGITGWGDCYGAAADQVYQIMDTNAKACLD